MTRYTTPQIMKYQLLYAKNAIDNAWTNANDNPEESRKLVDEAINWLEDYKCWLDRWRPEDKPKQSTAA